MFDADEIADELCELLRIDSLSGRELAVATVLSHRLEQMGLSTRFDDAHKAIDGQVGNLWARIDATAPGLPTLMLNAHMDTVKPGCGIQPRREGDLLCSSGDTILGGDDKAGIVIILAVVRKLLQDRPPHGDIHILFTIAEETGLTGAKNIDYTQLEADYALVLDGGADLGGIFTAAPSAMRLIYDITGKAAHSGVCPEEGISAIQAAARGIAQMKLGRIDGETTANIGIISGGEARNIIPPNCHLEGEARSHDPAKLQAQVQHMRRCIRQACSDIGAELNVEEVSSYTAFALPDDHPLVATALAAAADLGFDAHTKRGGGGSDANIYNEKGIPAIIMPTGASKPHTLQETVEVSKLGQCAQYLWAVIHKLQRRPAQQGR